MEYSKLTLPVLLYVLLEALHHRGITFVITSPEWGIATAFLAIHGPELCEEDVAGGARGVSALRMRFFRSLGLMLALIALLNSFVSLEHETALKVLVRLTLFCFASIAFVLVVGAARHRRLRMARQMSMEGSDHVT